jgi:sensor histidine kinase YesM
MGGKFHPKLNKDQIPIIDSLTMVESYLDLEHLRFGKRLSYTIDCDDSVSQVFLPALLIQPLVENAIKHGISPKVEGGHISVSVRKSANTCVIEITDNGVGWQNKQSDSGHGLVNIKERLRLLFNEEWTMEIESKAGVTVRVTFPLEEK